MAMFFGDMGGMFNLNLGKTRTPSPMYNEQKSTSYSSVHDMRKKPRNKNLSRSIKPHKGKKTDQGKHGGVEYAVCQMQGWRITMEDAHIMATDVNSAISFLFGVFDGHGGAAVANYLASELETCLADYDGFQEDEKPTDEDYFTAFSRIMEELDADIISKKIEGGSTACVAVITPKKVYVANVGDSRCVASIDGAAMALSDDHKPELRPESLRILKAGSTVTKGRVDGILAVSRSFGDARFKQKASLPASKQAVTATPDVRAFSRDGMDFLVIACDGVWNAMSNEAVVTFVSEQLQLGKSANDVCKKLLDSCLAKEGSRQRGGWDNMTVILVVFDVGGSSSLSSSSTTSSSTEDEEDLFGDWSPRGRAARVRRAEKVVSEDAISQTTSDVYSPRSFFDSPRSNTDSPRLLDTPPPRRRWKSMGNLEDMSSSTDDGDSGTTTSEE